MYNLGDIGISKFRKGSLLVKGVSEDILRNLIDPFLPKFNLGDVIQIIVGASILAVPVGFTEETWKLGESLPWLNVFLILGISIFFISLFTHLNYHRTGMKRSWPVFVRRVFFTYFLSFIVVAVLLTTIQRAPWETEWVLAVKRVIIVTFPSSMSAAVADVLK